MGLDMDACGTVTDDLPSYDLNRILLVDDDPDELELLESLLERLPDSRWLLEQAHSLDAGLEHLRDGGWACVLVDYRLGLSRGTDFIEQARLLAPALPYILFTSTGDRTVDIAAMRAGAAFFLDKTDLDAERLDRALRYAVERFRQDSDLVRTARRDPLTGLHNRVSLGERLDAALARGQRTGRAVGVAVLDLDGFKAVNDTVGHEVGDRLLEIVADRLRRVVRPYDTVGRLGGDEFVLILDDIGTDAEAGAVVARAVEAITPPFEVPSPLPSVGLSAGLAIFPAEGSDAQALLQVADQRMYADKAIRKGQRQKPKPASARPCVLTHHCFPELCFDVRTGRRARVEFTVRWRRDGQAISLQRLGAMGWSQAALDGLAARTLVKPIKFGMKVPAAWRLSGSALPILRDRVLEHPGTPPPEEILVRDLEGLRNHPQTAEELRSLGCRMGLAGAERYALGEIVGLDLQSLEVDLDTALVHTSLAGQRAFISSYVALSDRLDVDVVFTTRQDRELVATLRELGASYVQLRNLVPLGDDHDLKSC